MTRPSRRSCSSPWTGPRAAACASNSRASCGAPCAAAASRSGPRCRPRASWPATSASPAASSSTPTASSPPRATSRRARAPARASARPSRTTGPATAARRPPARHPDRGCSAGCPTRRASRERSGSATTARRSASSPPRPCRIPTRAASAALRAALAATSGRVRAVVTTPEPAPGLRRLHAGPRARLPRAAGPGRAAPRRRGSVLQLSPRAHRERRARTRAGPRRRQRHRRRPRSPPHDDVAGVLVAPAHSYPTRRGAGAAAARRARGVGARDDALIIEDDYDAEFRYDRAPIGALQGLRPGSRRLRRERQQDAEPDPPRRVARGARVAHPADLRREKLYDDLATGTLDQLALATFIESGDLARHLRRVRPVYRRRRDAALRALADTSPTRSPGGVAAGLHLYVRLPDDCDETRPRHRRAAPRACRWKGAARHWAEPEAAPPALVLGYGMAGEPAIEQGVADARRPPTRPRPGRRRRTAPLKTAPAEGGRREGSGGGSARPTALRGRLAADDGGDTAERDHHADEARRMQRLPEDGRRRDRGHRRDDEQQRADGARGVRPQQVDEQQQRDDRPSPTPASRARAAAAAPTSKRPPNTATAGVTRTAPVTDCTAADDPDVGAARPVLLHDGPAREPEHADQRHADADADARVPSSGARLIATPTSRRQPGPEARVAALLAGRRRRARW